MFSNVRRPIFVTFNRLFSVLTKDMDKHGVVPDVIEKAPEEILQVLQISDSLSGSYKIFILNFMQIFFL